MNRFLFPVCLAFLLLLAQVGITCADTPETTAITTTATTVSDRTGGSVYFETYPPGATIWLDSTDIGTTPFMYYSEKTGTLDVQVSRKGYENYTGTATVVEGRRVDFYAFLTPLSRETPKETAAPVSTATTIMKSTMKIPTPWPTTTASPVDPAVIIGAAATGFALFAIRRR